MMIERKRRKTLCQILLILEKRLIGMEVKDICIKEDIEVITFHRWEKQYGGIVQRHFETKQENERLRKMFTNLSVMHDALHETLVSILNENQEPLPSNNQQEILGNYERIAV